MQQQVLHGSSARRHAVRTSGREDGPPVVLGHGFGTDQGMWSRVVPAFEDDSHVVLFDHVGCGASDASAWDPRRYASLEGHAADLVALLDELALGPVRYVGHSAGAMIGVLAAVERPDLFGALVLLGGSPRFLDDPGTAYVGGFSPADVEALLEAMEANYLGWSRSLAPAVMGNPERPELAEELAQSFARAEERMALQFARAIFLSDHRAALRRLTVPALVVQPAEDPMVPQEVAHYLHRALPGSELALLRATGHFPHVSGVEETTSVVRRYLAAA